MSTAASVSTPPSLDCTRTLTSTGPARSGSGAVKMLTMNGPACLTRAQQPAIGPHDGFKAKDDEAESRSASGLRAT